MKTYDLRPSDDYEWREWRPSWVCYEVLHDGEGPCANRREILKANLRPQDAALHYARLYLDEEGMEDGDRVPVAVEVEPGVALFFVCVLRVVRDFEAHEAGIKPAVQR